MTLFPSPENMTSIFDIIIYGNSVTENVLGTGIIFSFYVSTFLYMLLRNNTFGDSAVVAGFLSVPIAIFLALAGIINYYALFVICALFVFSVLYNHIHKD